MEDERRKVGTVIKNEVRKDKGRDVKGKMLKGREIMNEERKIKDALTAFPISTFTFLSSLVPLPPYHYPFISSSLYISSIPYTLLFS